MFNIFLKINNKLKQNTPTQIKKKKGGHQELL